MLKGLDAIRWSELTHAYGSAEDIPEILRDLAAGLDDGYERTPLYELFGNIYHQGSVYEATAPAVPFLIEIAARSETRDRAGILQLIACIALGKPHRCGPDAYQAVVAGAEPLLGILDAERISTIGLSAAHALAQLKERRDDVRPRLHVLLAEAADDELASAALLLLLGHIEDRSPEALDALERGLAAGGPRQRAAVLALIRLKTVPLSAAASAALRAHLEAAEPTDIDGLPWEVEDEECTVGWSAAALLDEDTVHEIADEIIDSMEKDERNVKTTLLLDLLFAITDERRPSQQGRWSWTASELSDRHRRALRALAAWSQRHNHAVHHLTRWCLPGNLRRLQALGEGRDPPRIDQSLPVIGRGDDPSIPMRRADLAPGVRIHSRRSGFGTIDSCEHLDDSVSLWVDFDDEGRGWLSIKNKRLA